MFDVANFKVRISSEDESRAIQEMVIKAGGRWANQPTGNGKVDYLTKPYIFVRNGVMTYDSGDDEYFGLMDLTEAEFYLEVSYKAVPRPMKTITVLGKEYHEGVVRRLLDGHSI